MSSKYEALAELAPKTSGAIGEGAPVCWNATGSHVINASATGVYSISVAAGAAGSNDAACRVRLSGISVAAA